MRKSVFVVVLTLASVVVTAPAKTKKKAGLPQMFCQARYIFVQTYEGAPDPEIAHQYPGDYDAAVGVQQRVQKWDRYVLVTEKQQADLVLVVWRERPEGSRLPGQPTQMPPVRMPQMPDPGTGTGTGQNPGNPLVRRGLYRGGLGGPDGTGVSHGGSGVGAYPPNDQLAVYQAQSDESLQTPLWKKSEKDGLKEPNMTLFGQLADAVDGGCSQATGSSQ
jgi:hypothetical protein